MNFKTITKFLFISLFTIFATQSFAKPNSYVADSVITAKIKSKIAVDKSISVFNINVTTNNGVVTYQGVVDSDSQAEALFELAQQTDGVRNINTLQLSVKDSSHPIKDTLITAKVKTLLIEKHVFENKNVPLADVHVETNNSVVYLTGTAFSRAEIANAISVAKSVSGVKKVESRLQIAE